MGRAFANGTEGYAWQSVWCDVCSHDHSMHDGTGTGCDIFARSFLDDEVQPEWIEPPASYGFYLPPHIICTKYEPCIDCGGDPEPELRAAIVAQVEDAVKESE